MSRQRGSSGVNNLDVQELGLADEGQMQLDESGHIIDDEYDASEIVLESNLSSFNEKAAKLAFNEEPVIIQLHESTDPNAEKLVYVAINGEGAAGGVNGYLPRGVPVTVKRKFVENLCHARPVAYESVERMNQRGEREVIYPKTSALKYPFSVISDPNPKGAQWLSKLLSIRS